MTSKPVTKVSVQHLEIPDDHAGRRIDNYLIGLLGIPRSRVYRILRKGEVRVNKGRIKPAYRLKCGDIVRVPPLRQSEPDTVTIDPRLAAQLAASILYEDDDLMVLNKPAGMPVHAGSGYRHGLIENLRYLRASDDYLELVHRLDRLTSGCLLLAKRPVILRELNAMVRGSGMEKVYTALLCGRWQEGERRIEAPLRRNLLLGGERMVCVDAQGKEAISLFRPMHCYPCASLMEVRLLTGRTHQIRVHAAHLGFPVAGDDKYGQAECNRKLRMLGLKGMFLHAVRLSFEHPGRGERICIEAPLAVSHQDLLTRLATESAACSPSV